MTGRVPILLLVAAACVTAPPHEPSALDHRIRACDQRSGGDAPLARMLDDLARFDAVFFGETHLDETTHALELAVYEGLAERTGGRVVLALEMFERDVQGALDDYLAGRIPEADFLHRARPWGNYRTGYRPLIEAAKRRGLPVVASNAPVALRRKVGMEGRGALDALEPADRALLAAELLPGTEAYWERVGRAVRGHAMFQPTPEGRLLSAQSLWDNTMAESCALALDARPGWVVLHVNGAFHSQYRDGAVHQLLLRRPGTRVAVVEAVPADDLHGGDPFGATDRADWLVLVRRTASGLSEGFHSVVVAPELRFRLRVPPGATDAVPAPLLIWLPDDGFRAEDGLSLWGAALGDEAAVAVLEAPYPYLDEDLVQAGRWYWPETFDKDLSVAGDGLAKVLRYVAEHYPVDARRVAVAGEGTGATVAAAAALYADDAAVPYLAAAPRRFGKLRMLGLPGTEDRARLLLLALPGDGEWWNEEAADYRKAGLDVSVAEAPADAWERLQLVEDEVRAALRLAARPQTAGEPKVLTLEHDTPRAREWARRYARRLGGPVSFAKEGALRLSFGAGGAFRPQDLSDGRCLPVAAGPFGGTTVLIVPEGTPEEERAAWKALEQEGAIRKRSPFARLVVLFESEGAGGLAAALEAIRAAGRRSVLVVPAVFCADADAMRRWRAEARPFEDTLDLAWLPGLGGRLHLLAGDGK